MAVSLDASVKAPGVSTAPRQVVQSTEVSSTVADGVVVRDGYTVQAAPKVVVPKVVPKKSSSSGLSVSMLGGLDTGQLRDQAWRLPVVGRITDAFGPRPDLPVNGVEPFHAGVDIAAPCGTPVLAATGGTVVFAGYDGSFGNFVRVDHGNGVQTTYAHNSVIRASVGQSVAAGEVISEVGSTGASTGCHLDFRVEIDGTRINPVPFMSARGITLG
jgi:murein DD-endopeptidase MepM/ murein hydrolase activator NlpD